MRDQVMAEFELPAKMMPELCFGTKISQVTKGRKSLRGKKKITKLHRHSILLRIKNSNTSLNTKSGCEILSKHSIFVMTFIKLVFKVHSVHNLSWSTGKKK